MTPRKSSMLSPRGLFGSLLLLLALPTVARAGDEIPSTTEASAAASGGEAPSDDRSSNGIASEAKATGRRTATLDKSPVLAKHLPKPDPSAASTNKVEEKEAASDKAALAPAALPTGGDKSGVTGKAISIPKGAGSIEGMGESFSTQLSTGVATFSVPFSLPKARGAAQPALGISYSSGSGQGLVGLGWSVGVPFIARQTDRGTPGYDDRANWHAEQDGFVFNGGQELVPICTVQAGLTCVGAISQRVGVPNGSPFDVLETMPAWAAGWQYFRPRVEGSFQRFFWSPDHRTWRVQDKSGVTMELGVPLDDPTYLNALDRNPEPTRVDREEIYRWHLVRQFDAQGSSNAPVAAVRPNLVAYAYTQSGNTALLTDIYDTPSAPGVVDVASFAHHTRLRYADRPDPTATYRSGWRMDQLSRLVGVDVTSRTFNDVGEPRRHVVRRYHLSYANGWHQSLLESLQIEGRCGEGEDAAPAEAADGSLSTTDCARLPAMTFSYQHVTPYTTGGEQGVAGLAGYEGFDARVQTMVGSPKHSIDEALTDFLDVNADGMPDLLVTAPGLYYSGSHAAFFNGASGATGFGAVQTMGFSGVLGADAAAVTLRNMNVAPLDLDGDGFVNLLHMPKAQSYGIYSPTRSGGTWTWQGREVSTATRQDTKIDFTKDALDTQILDANADGLVDVVVTTGTQIQTYFSLGRYPGGDGQFGSAEMTGPLTSRLSNDPVTHCVPWAGAAVRFSDKEVKTADMNGDGLVDIVKLQRGQIRYWPGRGNGFWGNGKRDDCTAGTFGASRYLEMTSSPQFSDVDGDSLRLDDVNGDGMADLVQIRTDAVDVWINVDGTGWTERSIIQGTPASPNYATRVRLLDIRGTGTPAVVWGNSGSYQYMDLTGGKKPGLLVGVANGLGKTTTLEYSTSTTEMLAAESKATCPESGVPAGGDPWAYGWCKKMPTVAQIVKRVIESDNLVAAGQGPSALITEYEYRDPVYEGRQREFRGFTRARTRRLGDANSPTDLNESVFLLGECIDEDRADKVDGCSLSERWRDNPMEALKGLPVVTEQSDLAGRTLSTNVTHYDLRVLYKGLDGRDVRHALATETTTYRYDTSATFASAGTVRTTVASRRELSAGTGGLSAVTSALPIFGEDVPIRSASHAVTKTLSDADFLGNQYLSISLGCVAGCDGGGEDEQIISATIPGQPDNNQNGWLWRTVETWTHGNLHGSNRYNDQLTSYDQSGNPEVVTAELRGSLPLDRAAIPGDSSPQAPGRSVDGTITLSHTDYDAYGNPTHTEMTNGRCVDTSYDNAFHLVATTETVHHQGCASAGLSRGASYDLGFALVTNVVDFNGLATRASYDAFGRTVSLSEPSLSSVGLPASHASVIIEYFLPPSLGPSVAAMRVRTEDGGEKADNQYHESWTFVDGFGRDRVSLSEADPTAGDGGNWIVSDQETYGAKGAVQRKHIEYFWTGSPPAFDIGAAPATPYGSQRYDAFDREVQTFDIDGTMTQKRVYHATSVDTFDASDIISGPHTGTYLTEVSDGHDRPIRVSHRTRIGGQIEVAHELKTFSPSGDVETVTRRRGNNSATDVTRWMRYDSLGRQVLNVDSHATTDYQSPPAPDTDVATYSPPSGMRAWRYQYNDSNDLVGTSDARGCGSDYAYDSAGRLVGEDYFPCATHHQPYSAPNAERTAGWEVAYFYDAAPPGGELPPELGALNLANGRLVAIRDRAAETWTNLDNGGRINVLARRVAAPTDANEMVSDNLVSRYTSQWFYRHVDFDAADRAIAETTGAQGTAFEGATAGIFTGTRDRHVVQTHYSARGTINAVDGSYGALIARVNRRADGLVDEVVYGDAASTTTSTSYDARRRPVTVQTYRAGTPLWTQFGPGGSGRQGVSYAPAPSAPGTPTTFQMLLEDTEIAYDVVGNPIEIRDWRDPSEWPAGSKPVHKKAEYDDQNRVRKVSYEYSAGDDAWVSPVERENTEDADPVDRRRAKPVPQIHYDTRVLGQNFEYDWLGNLIKTDDDKHGFYDRSLGAVSHGSAQRPYQVTSANNESLAPPSGVDRTGNAAVAYDAAGNVIGLGVVRRGLCLPSGSYCTQQYAYDWDEVGRLMRARRWDSAAVAVNLAQIPTAVPAIDLRYRYDSSDQRVIKRSYATAAEDQRHTLYVFPSLELRRTDFADGQYSVDELTQVPYIMANNSRLARLQYEQASTGVPEVSGVTADPGATGTAATLHVLLELSDSVGSINSVVDKATGELVEKSTYLAYGQRESDYRPTRWAGFREDYGFTGKEEDVEVGLQYFGKRFLIPSLGRWASPDPLALHDAEKADLNLYAYVEGRVLLDTDPVGLTVGEMFRGMFTEAKVQAKAILKEAVRPAAMAMEGRYAEAAREVFINRHPIAAALRSIESVAAVPGQLKAAFDEPNDFEKGRLALAPLATLGSMAVASIGGAGAGALSKSMSRLRMPKGGGVKPRVPATSKVVKQKGVCTGGSCSVDGPGGVKGTGTTGCFTAGTLVWTANGLIPIQQLQVGMQVLSAPEKGDQELRWGTVLDVYERSVDATVHLDIVDEVGGAASIVTTTEHPFWRYGAGWLPAKDLRSSDRVWSAERGWLRIVRTALRYVQEPVYNLRVDSSHTYFVSGLAVWVHNAKCPVPSGDGASSAPAAGAPVRNANGGVDFADTSHLYPAGEGQSNTVRIQYTGSRRQDFGAANRAAGVGTTQKPPKDYTWHHLDDYDPATNSGTMQLVETSAHESTYPHNGGVKQYQDATGKKYR